MRAKTLFTAMAFSWIWVAGASENSTPLPREIAKADGRVYIVDGTRWRLQSGSGSRVANPMKELNVRQHDCVNKQIRALESLLTDESLGYSKKLAELKVSPSVRISYHSHSIYAGVTVPAIALSDAAKPEIKVNIGLLKGDCRLVTDQALGQLIARRQVAKQKSQAKAIAVAPIGPARLAPTALPATP